LPEVDEARTELILKQRLGRRGGRSLCVGGRWIRDGRRIAVAHPRRVDVHPLLALLVVRHGSASSVTVYVWPRAIPGRLLRVMYVPSRLQPGLPTVVATLLELASTA